jgi:hypothetical protein
LEVCYNKQDLVFEYLGNNTASIPEGIVRIPSLTEEVCDNSISVFNSTNYINEKSCAHKDLNSSYHTTSDLRINTTWE